MMTGRSAQDLCSELTAPCWNMSQNFRAFWEVKYLYFCLIDLQQTQFPTYTISLVLLVEIAQYCVFLQDTTSILYMFENTCDYVHSDGDGIV